jgi:glycolate oxidase iron-sulfur subunit
MQTTFTEDQLRDPDTAESNKILRTCVHCGFCTATCPTFVLRGDELDSPRAASTSSRTCWRTTARDAGGGEACRPLPLLPVLHDDLPSGVHYMHLVDHARRHIEETYERPRAGARAAAAALGAAALSRAVPAGADRRLARAALRAARAGQGADVGAAAGDAEACAGLGADALPMEKPGVHRAEGERRGRVALLTGCAQQVLAPSINEATIRLLTRMGIEVVVTTGQGCCGALDHHMGHHDPAMRLARANIEAWHAELAGEGLDAVVINASGCGTTVKDYGFMFRTEPGDLPEKAATIAALAMDVSEVLTKFAYAPTRAKPDLTVAYHAACSLQHGQKITGVPKDLLKRAGFAVKEPAEGHLCCGSAGTYNLLQPEISGKLRERKLANLDRTRADLIASGNIGCLTQLAGGTMPTVHTVELLDWMAGGPEPPQVAMARSAKAAAA